MLFAAWMIVLKQRLSAGARVLTVDLFGDGRHEFNLVNLNAHRAISCKAIL